MSLEEFHGTSHKKFKLIY